MNLSRFITIFSLLLSLEMKGQVKLAAKVFLQEVSTTTLLMNDYIRTLSNFPLIDPYSVLGAFGANYIHVNNTSIDTIQTPVLAISGNNAVVDWVFVELRQTTLGGNTTVAYTQSGLLLRNGNIVDTDAISPLSIPNAPPGNYYITIRHRSHLGFRTANAFALSNTPTTLNFTNNSTLLFGSYPLIALSSNVYAMNGGDGNGDGSIDSFDTITWEVENGLFDDYSLNSDYNMDGSVDSFDSIIWELNNGKYQDLN